LQAELLIRETSEKWPPKFKTLELTPLPPARHPIFQVVDVNAVSRRMKLQQFFLVPKKLTGWVLGMPGLYMESKCWIPLHASMRNTSPGTKWLHIRNP